MVKTGIYSLLVLAGLPLSFCAQTHSQTDSAPRLVGGPCEGCEAIFEHGNKLLTSTTTLPGFQEAETKLKVSGTVFQPDGKTPAPDVLLYVYHTNAQGIYPTRGTETNWAKRHGYLRGWVKTNANGRYTFYTGNPGSYPDRSTPAHIHVTLLEPNGKYYYLQDYHFADDSLLTPSEASPVAPRGGSSGLLELKQEGEVWVGTRNFVLGKNVPNYAN